MDMENKMKVVGNRLRWAGHVQRISGRTEEGGRKRRGRPKLRWRDNLKRYLERDEQPRVGENGRRSR